MKRNVLGYLVVLMLTVAGCGSDSPSEPQTNKDAAMGKDAPFPGSDVPAADTRDTATTNADVVVPADTKDAPVTTDDAGPQADTKDVRADARDAAADLPGVVDATADMAGVDFGGGLDASGERPGLETGAPEVAIDASAVKSFPCRNDSDCCILIDGCMNVAYLYSKAPGAAAPPTIPPPAGGMCTACIPPAIQVRCVSSQCTGEKIPGYPSSLLTSHCGVVSIPDGGASNYHTSIDAGAVSTKSSWGCGGD
jgi:hypothetical protein